MKFAVTLCATLVCGLTLAGEPVSVLNHGTATPAAAPVTTAAPVVVAPAPAVTPDIVIVEQPRRSKCASGKCKLYNVEEQSHEYVRNRVLGGHVIRRNSRTVLRPVR